jgi:hypothetical protein
MKKSMSSAVKYVPTKRDMINSKNIEGKWALLEISHGKIHNLGTGLNQLGSTIKMQLIDSVGLFDFKQNKTLVINNNKLARWKIEEQNLNFIDYDTMLNSPIILSGNYRIEFLSKSQLVLTKGFKSAENDILRIQYLLMKERDSVTLEKTLCL